MEKDNKISYFNTLMFTIFTAIASLGVLSFLLFDFGKKFIYFIVAFEVGVFTLIGYCIYKIIKGDKKANDIKTKYVVRFDECPDYYSRKVINGDDFCFNEYLVKDYQGNPVLIKISPAEIDGITNTPEASTILNTTIPPTDNYSKFKLHRLEADEKIADYSEKCKIVYTKPSVSDSKYDNYTHYPDIPYTYIKSRCASLAE